MKKRNHLFWPFTCSHLSPPLEEWKRPKRRERGAVASETHDGVAALVLGEERVKIKKNKKRQQEETSWLRRQREAESREPDFTECYAEINALLHNRKRLCQRSQRTRLFVEFIHVKRLPTIWPQAWYRARFKGNTRAWGLIIQWAGPYIGRHAYPEKIKEMAGGEKMQNKSQTSGKHVYKYGNVLLKMFINIIL